MSTEGLVTTDAQRIPDAKFTMPLLSAWVISLFGNLMTSFSFGVTGAVKERYVLPGHTRFQWSVCVAIFSIGGLVGSLIGGQMGTTWARKRGMMATAVLHIVAGVLMACSFNVFMLAVGRLLGGISAGMTGIFVPLYIRELSAPNLRGRLGTGFQLIGTIGILFCDLMAFAFSGKYQSVLQPGWRMLIGFSAVIGFVQMGLVWLIPESPCWLVDMNRLDEAAAVLKRLRGVEDVSIELQSIKKGLDESKLSSGDKALSLMDVIRDRGIRRQLVIACMMPLMQQFSGTSAIMFYANQFFEQAGLTNPLLGTTLVGVVNFVSTCVALVLMDRAGRRPLLIVSCTGMVFAQIVLTLALLGVIPSGTTVSVIGVLVSIMFYEFGLGPIAWLLAAEILPPVPRSHGCSLAMVMLNVCSFTSGLAFPKMQQNLKDFTFVPYTCCMALGLVFTIYFVPETKNRTVEEIYDDIQQRKAKHQRPRSGKV